MYAAGNPGLKIPLLLAKKGEGSSWGGLKAVGVELWRKYSLVSAAAAADWRSSDAETLGEDVRWEDGVGAGECWRDPLD